MLAYMLVQGDRTEMITSEEAIKMNLYTRDMRITDNLHHPPDSNLTELCNNCENGTIVEAEAKGSPFCECKECSNNEHCGTYYLCHDCYKADMAGV